MIGEAALRAPRSARAAGRRAIVAAVCETGPKVADRCGPVCERGKIDAAGAACVGASVITQ